MNIVQIGQMIGDTELCINYLRNRNLLSKEYFCCGHEAKVIYDNCNDGQMFRCIKCHKKKSIRHGSFFSRSSLKLSVVLAIIFYFATGVSATNCVLHLIGHVGRKGVLQWYTYCREICSLYLLTDGNIRLGGPPENIVQIDETFMRGKLKYERGDRRKRCKPQIIFGMIDTQTKNVLLDS